jgi:hypothetical protein
MMPLRNVLVRAVGAAAAATVRHKPAARHMSATGPKPPTDAEFNAGFKTGFKTVVAGVLFLLTLEGLNRKMGGWPG